MITLHAKTKTRSHKNIERTAPVRGPFPIVFRPAFLIRLRLLFIPRKRGENTALESKRNPSFKICCSAVPPCYLSFLAFLYIQFAFALYIYIYLPYSSQFSFLSFVFAMVFLFSSIMNLHNEAVTTTNSSPPWKKWACRPDWMMDQLQQLSSLLSCQFGERSKLSSDVYRRLHAHRRPTNISLISFPCPNT